MSRTPAIATTANANYRLEVWVRSAGNTVDLPEGFPPTSAYRDIFFAISTPPTTVTGLSADRILRKPATGFSKNCVPKREKQKSYTGLNA